MRPLDVALTIDAGPVFATLARPRRGDAPCVGHRRSGTGRRVARRGSRKLCSAVAEILRLTLLVQRLESSRLQGVVGNRFGPRCVVLPRRPARACSTAAVRRAAPPRRTRAARGDGPFHRRELVATAAARRRRQPHRGLSRDSHRDATPEQPSKPHHARRAPHRVSALRAAARRQVASPLSVSGLRRACRSRSLVAGAALSARRSDRAPSPASSPASASSGVGPSADGTPRPRVGGVATAPATRSPGATQSDRAETRCSPAGLDAPRPGVHFSDPRSSASRSATLAAAGAAPPPVVQRFEGSHRLVCAPRRPPRTRDAATLARSTMSIRRQR